MGHIHIGLGKEKPRSCPRGRVLPGLVLLARVPGKSLAAAEGAQRPEEVAISQGGSAHLPEADDMAAPGL